MKVLLVFPTLSNGIEELSYTSVVSKLASRIVGWGETTYTPPLSLLMVGAVTPADIEVKMVDERIEPLNFDEPADLVGISVVTRAAKRAYEIAGEFKSRGVKVVLGGIHPSALPEESSQYADAIVTGEGEGVWPELLEDARQGKLKEIYRGRPQLNLDDLPFPRRELIQNPRRYGTTKVIIATRGCPNTCTFCAAGIGLLKKFRTRSVENVLAELEQVPGNVTGFLDDNIGWNVDYAKELFRAMIPLRMRWTGSITVSALEDEELVKLAAESGCFMIGVGFESLSTKAIMSVRKQRTNQPERYAALIKRCQDYGITVSSSFILGFDDENESQFPSLIEFVNRTNIEYANVYILTPLPGSVLFRKMDREGRLLHKDWDYYESMDGAIVYKPKQMSPSMLLDGSIHVQEEIFSLKSILPRLLRAKTRFSFGSLAALHTNLESRSFVPPQRKMAEEYKKNVLGVISGSD